MPWLQLKLDTNDKYSDEIGDVMLQLGALSVTLMDAKDVPILEPAPGETPLWHELSMMMLFEADVDTKHILEQWQANPLANKASNIKFEQFYIFVDMFLRVDNEFASVRLAVCPKTLKRFISVNLNLFYIN